MSFSIYVSAFDSEEAALMPMQDIRSRFADYIDGEEAGMLFLQFDSPLTPATEVGFRPNDSGMISAFFVRHPPEAEAFWEAIGGILRDYPCLLYWPGTTAVMGSLDLLPHIPRAFIEKLGIPFVSRDGVQIRKYVWDHS